MESQPTVPASVLIETRMQALHAQLERMRAMLYKYSDLFYKLIVLAILVLILMTMASMTDALRATVLLIPFFIIYVGVQSAYFLTYVVFARVYATGIEQRINRLLADDTLIAHRIEADYLFPLKGSQFAGVPLRAEQTFIGFITIHFWLLGAAAIFLSAYRSWQLLPAIARLSSRRLLLRRAHRMVAPQSRLSALVLRHAPLRKAHHANRRRRLRRQLRRSIKLSLRLLATKTAASWCV